MLARLVLLVLLGVGCLLLVAAPGVAPGAERERIAISVFKQNPGNPTTYSRSIETIDPSGAEIATLVSDPAMPLPGAFADLSWSPDASKLVYSPSESGVFVTPGGQLLPTLNTAPSWSPGGDEIAYWSFTESQGWFLRAIHPDGSGSHAINGGGPNTAGAAPVSWSPDGKTLVYSTAPGPDTAGNLLKLPAAGGTATYLIPPEGDGSRVGIPSFSPDGKYLAYIRQLLTGAAYRRLEILDLATGIERTVTTTLATTTPTKVSWSPDGKRLAYVEAASFCGYGDSSFIGCDLKTINADGSDKRTIFHAEFIASPAWSPPPDPMVAVDTPIAGQEISGHPKDAAQSEAMRLTGSVSSRTDPSGWCFAAQAPGAPDPPRPSKADCSRPFVLTLTGNGRTTAQFDADLTALVGKDLRPGDNTVWVWGYDAGTEPGLAKVGVKVTPNYFIKHVEVAQALSPEFDPPAAVDPMASDPYPISWEEPSVAGFGIPLVARKRTLLRIYVGDSVLADGLSSTRDVAYRVTGTPADPIAGGQRVVVTAPDVSVDQKGQSAAVDVWLPASATPADVTRLRVEVNPDEQEKECDGCFPNGNLADVTGLQFAKGGGVRLLPVDVAIGNILHSVAPSTDYEGIADRMRPLLPVADEQLTASVVQPHRMITVDLRLLKAVPPSLQGIGFPWACSVVLREIELYALMHPMSPVPGLVTRWAGFASDSPGFTFPCSGLAQQPGGSFMLTDPRANYAVHEFGHTLGLPHTLGFGPDVPGGAIALPYYGIGALGYDADKPDVAYDKSDHGDIMSYSPKTWTSPRSWQVMFDEILARSGGPAAGLRRAHAARTAAQGSFKRRRLVSGVVAGGRAVITDSVVVDALAPEGTGPVTGRLVGLSRRGRQVATAPIHGPTDAPASEAGPFVVALPPADRVASLEVRSADGRRRLARLTASKHAPRGRFVGLRRRAPATRSLTVRWAASDRDHSDTLSVILLGRRGRGRWQAITIGPAKMKAAVDLGGLGRGGNLNLRLVVSDGLRTTVVRAKPVKIVENLNH